MIPHPFITVCSCLTLLVLNHLELQADPVSEKLPYPTYGSIERHHPDFDHLLAPDSSMEKLASGFKWTEGPVWRPEQHDLLFSDVPMNTIYRWKEGEGVSIFQRPSGFTGENYRGWGMGSNGLMLDNEGQLIICQHGDRRIARLNLKTRSYDTIADTINGQRFNSPNDLIVDKNGNIYFTDPCYGWAEDYPMDLDYSGVFKVTPDGKVTVLTDTIAWPNGIALSPDEKTLYVSSSEGGKFFIKAFPLHADGLGNGPIIFDANPFSKDGISGSTDGMCVDTNGNIWTTGPGGVYVISPEGTHLGTLFTGQPCGNCTLTEDGMLYIMSNHDIARIQTLAQGL